MNRGRETYWILNQQLHKSPFPISTSIAWTESFLSSKWTRGWSWIFFNMLDGFVRLKGVDPIAISVRNGNSHRGLLLLYYLLLLLNFTRVNFVLYKKKWITLRLMLMEFNQLLYILPLSLCIAFPRITWFDLQRLSSTRPRCQHASL
jgi:hypothetical protein